jgi:hypothetical protein
MRKHAPGPLLSATHRECHILLTVIAVCVDRITQSTMGSDLVHSILSPEWNADKTRVDKVRY